MNDDESVWAFCLSLIIELVPTGGDRTSQKCHVRPLIGQERCYRMIHDSDSFQKKKKKFKPAI